MLGLGYFVMRDATRVGKATRKEEEVLKRSQQKSREQEGVICSHPYQNKYKTNDKPCFFVKGRVTCQNFCFHIWYSVGLVDF